MNQSRSKKNIMNYEMRFRKLLNSTLILFIFSLLITFFIFVPGSSAEKKNTKKTKAEIKEEQYTIGCGDVLEIVTWKENDFSRSGILVRTDGKITFPLLDDIQASGRTTYHLKKEIEKGLKDYLDSPVVTVSVTNPVSQRFYILGEIANTGEYPLSKSLTVLQAFALAGGFTEWASKKEILLLRKEKGKDKIIRVNYKNIIKGKDLGHNLKIKADDTIIVP